MSYNLTNISVISIANEFIRLAKEEDVPMIHLKLQKLCYIAHGYCLAIFSKSLFKEEIGAWRYGPVIEELYYKYSKYKNSDIPYEVEIDNNQSIDEDLKKLISVVWSKYKTLTPATLVSLTHEENTPWYNAYHHLCSNYIPNDNIQKYYLEVINADD